MRSATRFVALALGLLGPFAIGACRTPADTLALVETAPVETTLDQADLPETADVWVELIDGASTSIELAHFYASNREGGRLEPVVQALIRAAERGVHVRFLADAGFHETYPDTLDRLDRVPGIEVRLYDLRALTGGVLHQKTMLVDGRHVWIGSANFDWRALEHIQELGVVVQSEPVALAIGDAFELDWTLAGGAEPGAPRPEPRVGSDDFPVQLVFAGRPVRVWPGVSPLQLAPEPALWDLDRLVAWIDAARESVVVQLLSYHAHERTGERFGALDDALRRAAERGVSVRLLVAHWSQRRSRIAELQALQRIPGIQVGILTVPEHSSGFEPFSRVAHAKYCVVDGLRAWVGTSNWSRDYFEKSRNVGVFVDGKPFAGRLAAFFEDGWASAYAEVVDPDGDYAEPRVAQ